jgi:hypothetical protein
LQAWWLPAALLHRLHGSGCLHRQAACARHTAAGWLGEPVFVGGTMLIGIQSTKCIPFLVTAAQLAALPVAAAARRSPRGGASQPRLPGCDLSNSHLGTLHRAVGLS